MQKQFDQNPMAGSTSPGGDPPAPAPLQSASYTELVMQHTTELIALIDSAGRYRFVTPSFQQLGYPATDLIGQRYADFIHPDDYRLAQEHAQTPQVANTDLTVRFRCSDGSWRQIAARTRTVAHEGETLSMFIGRDITTLREHEEQLIQAQRTIVISALTTGMIHDLNNMLTIIAGSADIVAETLPQDHPVQPDLATISAVTEHAGSLTNQVSAYMRNQHQEFRQLQLDALLHENHSLIKRIAGPLIDVKIDIAPDLWPINGVASAITQSILSLVVNAHDVLPTGGTLTIQARNARLADASAHSPDDAVLLEISGTSSRLSNQAQQQIFAPLANPSMAADAPGISLNYCRRTIQLHGGTLQFADTVGQGATLRITLPRA